MFCHTREYNHSNDNNDRNTNDNNDACQTSGSGGSGLVVIKLLTSDYSGTTTGSPSVSTSGSYTILTYTGSGTYTV